MAEKRMAIATWKVTLEGKDLTVIMRPRLISLSLSEKRGDDADRLEITLNDSDGQLEIPPAGKTLKVSMGWAQGTGLPIGLVEKGEFKVDEATWEGDPDQINICARSADFTDAFRVRRERSFVGQTVGDILGAIAADNGLTPHIDATLAAKSIPALGSGARSDAALLKELGRRFDAVATVKAGRLIFSPVGKGETVSGTGMPAETFDRSECGPRPRYSRAERDTYNGVEASYHDKATGTRKTVVAGGGNGDGKPKRLKKTYASEKSARHAAEAEDKRVARSKAKMTLTLAYGRPDITPERPITLTGFKAEINERKWLVSEASHAMDGAGGLRTSLNLEASA
jgi:phage protein D